MKEDAFHNSTVSADQVVAEVRQAAAGYLRRSGNERLHLAELAPQSAREIALGGCVIAAVWGAELIIRKRCLNNRQRFF